MIQYNPEDANKKCWPEADYDAVLISVEDGISKTSGNEMEIWQIGCYHPDGREQTIKEYVTASSIFKLKQLAIALGRRAEFDAGTFQAESHVGAGFTVALGIEQSDSFDDKNKVNRIKAKGIAAPAATAPSTAQAPPRSIAAGARQQIQNRPAPTNPISEEKQFADADIPF